LTKKISYSAPGRVCLYGEHQDYLKLTVIPAAIDLRTTISVERNNLNEINIESQDLKKTDVFEVNNSITLAKNEFDYFRAIILVLYKEGLVKKIPGFNVTVSSQVPIGSGLSSSAAILVSWLTALNDQLNLELSRTEIANLCFIAENKILGVNCGIMDQYSSSLGGIFSLDCDGPPHKIQCFTTKLDGLVIGDSCVRRSANEPLTLLKSQIINGFEKIKEQGDFNLKTLASNTLTEFRDIITEEEYRRLLGVITIRNITERSSKELSKSENQDIKCLGTLLTKQQTMLRDYLGVSIPELDNLVDISLKSGALGAKLTGAGLGGCIIALAPGKEEEVAAAINNAGGKATICKIDFEGAKKE
jgi:galactokinase